MAWLKSHNFRDDVTHSSNGNQCYNDVYFNRRTHIGTDTVADDVAQVDADTLVRKGRTCLMNEQISDDTCGDNELIKWKCPPND